MDAGVLLVAKRVPKALPDGLLVARSQRSKKVNAPRLTQANVQTAASAQPQPITTRTKWPRYRSDQADGHGPTIDEEIVSLGRAG